VPPAMPIHARRTRPSRISAEITARVVGVDRDPQPEPDAGDRGVDADHAAAAVHQRAAGVAGLSAASVWMTSSTIGSCRAEAGRQRAAERGDHAGGHRAGEPVAVADRDHELGRRAAQRRRRARRARAPRPRRAAPRGRTAGPAPTTRASTSPPVGERGADARAAPAGSRPRGRT
jgi:hypothetical protein